MVPGDEGHYVIVKNIPDEEPEASRLVLRSGGGGTAICRY